MVSSDDFGQMPFRNQRATLRKEQLEMTPLLCVDKVKEFLEQYPSELTRSWQLEGNPGPIITIVSLSLYLTCCSKIKIVVRILISCILHLRQLIQVI